MKYKTKQIMNRIIVIASLLFSYLSYGQEKDMILIENVNVIPMNEEVILKNQRVIISEGKILTIEPTLNQSSFKPKLIIDGTGKYLIPGLAEMHYHWQNETKIEQDFKLLIANGITTVRNMAEYKNQDHIAIRDKVQKGEILGPNYYTTGPYLQATDFKSINDVIEVVKKHKEKGYDYLKIGDGFNIPKDIYLKLLEQAYINKIDVIGHAQHNLPLEYSLRMKSIEHIEEFIYTFHENKKNYNELNNDSEFLERAAEQIKNSGIYIAPTIGIVDMITQYLDDKKFTELKQKSVAKYLPPKNLNTYFSNENTYIKAFKGKKINGVDFLTMFNDYVVWIKKFTKILSNHGVPLLSGSDTFGMYIPGFSLHSELELMQESGLTPYQVLKTSTITPARYLNSISLEGTISEGKNANLLLLNKNPLEDVRNTRTIHGVLLKGKWLDRVTLDTMLKDVEISNSNKH
jgi:imidazolonepropionase-like amidohydrolase